MNKPHKTFGQYGKPLRTFGQFVLDNHQHIAPLAHGLAVISGNETAQKITGAGLALSQGVQLVEKGLQKKIEGLREKHRMDRPNFDIQNF